MIVYIESNFILELTFVQQEHLTCQKLLELAERNKIRLVIPAFSISEPYDTWYRKSTERKLFHDRLILESRTFSRSDLYRAFSDKADEVARMFISSIDEDKNRLDNTMQRVLGCADIIDASSSTIKEALQFQQLFGLESPDSIIYASVVSDLSRRQAHPSCFLNKNSKDFSEGSGIPEHLASFDCKLFTNFNQGLNYITGSIR